MKTIKPFKLAGKTFEVVSIERNPLKEDGYFLVNARQLGRSEIRPLRSDMLPPPLRETCLSILQEQEAAEGEKEAELTYPE